MTSRDGLTRHCHREDCLLVILHGRTGQRVQREPGVSVNALHDRCLAEMSDSYSLSGDHLAAIEKLSAVWLVL